jgi:hypothetical protein
MRRLTRLPAFVIAVSACLLAGIVVAKDGVTVTLPDQRVAVIAVGDLESASIGSYSVTIYKDRSLLDFQAGAVFVRNGSLFQDNGKPRVKFADVTGDGVKELIVSILTAGSGNYLQVDALSIDARGVRLLTRIQTDSRHDVITELKAACKRGQCSG